MLKTVKQNLLKSAKFLGFSDFLSKSSWRQNKLLILAYHGVSLEDEHLWNSSLFMPPDLLRRRFELIKKHGCNVLPLGEAVERLYDETLPERSVAITFDDGNYDFYRRAFPIVKEFNFPATVYLTTFYSEYNKPVFNVAAKYLLWKGKSKTLDCQSLFGRDERINLETENERQRAYDLLFEYALENKFSAEQKNDLLERMCENLQIDYAEFCDKRIVRLMNAAEVSEIASAGIDVQLHTHRHRVPLDEKLFLREIEDNRRAITSSAAARPVTHFCYPSGEYKTEFFPWMKAANVVSATTCETALSTPETNRFLLPRLVDTCSLSEVEFEGWLAGISHFLPQRRNS
jgi:peptidoglycan/xylan/chitin deacetylase (PgdA/CDA1 family)